jgi:hypothetical protein
MGDLTLALAIRPGASPLFPEISSDRQALDDSLMKMIASECSDIKAGPPGSVPCGSDPWPHRDGFALRRSWPVKNTHDVVPYIGREHNTLSHRQMPLKGGDEEQSSTPVSRHTGQYRPHLKS